MKRKAWALGALATAALAAGAALCLTGCANLGYYWQSVTGHLKVLNAAKPVQEWLDEFERIQLMLRTSGRLRQKHGD